MLNFWATETVTIWSIGGADEDGQPLPSVPRLATAAYKSGGKTRRDNGGNEFVPRSTFYLTTPVSRSEYIAPGDHTTSLNPTGNAERIRDVGEYSPQSFAGRTEPVYEAYTE